MARRSLSKRLRFEVFERDGFTCQYCGRTTPAVILEVDHVIPVSKQGSNEPENLITACIDCNRGKHNHDLKASPEELSDRLALLREKQEQIKKYSLLLKKQDRQIIDSILEIDQQFASYFPGYRFTTLFCDGTLRQFLRALPLPVIRDALSLAASHFPKDRERTIRYFCGVCWNRIKNPETRRWPVSDK